MVQFVIHIIPIDVMAIAGSKSLSIWQLVVGADPVVKMVVLVLVAASVASWSIIFDKMTTLKPLWQSMHRIFTIMNTQDIGSIDGREHGFFDVMIKLAQSTKKTMAGKDKSEWMVHSNRLQYRLASFSGGVHTNLTRHMNVLASIGSSAVFVALFGTVWGIMNSFRAIASSQNTHLSVVAPGISEALFVTAAGLMVAIPAMVAYNRMTDKINQFMENIDRLSYELLAWVTDE